MTVRRNLISLFMSTLLKVDKEKLVNTGVKTSEGYAIIEHNNDEGFIVAIDHGNRWSSVQTIDRWLSLSSLNEIKRMLETFISL